VRRDAWPPAVLAVAGVLAINEARRLRFGTVAVPGPGFFPLALAVSFAAVSLVLLVIALRASGVGQLDGGAGTDRHPEEGGAKWKVLATLAAMTLYAFALEPAGFVVSTAGLVLFFFRVLERQRWVVAVPASMLTSIATYVVFKMWLQVRLPPGPWGL